MSFKKIIIKNKVQDNLRLLHSFVMPCIIYEKQVYRPFPNF